MKSLRAEPVTVVQETVPFRPATVDCGMENDNVNTSQHQQHNFEAEKIAVVALQGVRPEEENTSDHHHGEAGEHPRSYERECLRNGVSLHRSADKTKIEPDNRPNGQPQPKNVGAFDDRK